jgi:hypothetical protein
MILVRFEKGGAKTGQSHLEFKLEMMGMCSRRRAQTQLQTSLVTGHDFSRAAEVPKKNPALAAAGIQWRQRVCAGAKVRQFLLFVLHD